MTPNDITQHELWTKKKVNNFWFHITREQVQNGTIAKIGAVPWAVYCVIKSHIGLQTGDAWPSTARIGELVGCGADTVFRALKKLVEAGLIVPVKAAGRNTQYTLTEKLDVKEPDGKPWATGERKYVPAKFQEFVDQLQRLASTGNMPTDKAINIIFNIVIGDDNTVSLVANTGADGSASGR